MTHAIVAPRVRYAVEAVLAAEDIATMLFVAFVAAATLRDVVAPLASFDADTIFARPLPSSALGWRWLASDAAVPTIAVELLAVHLGIELALVTPTVAFNRGRDTDTLAVLNSLRLRLLDSKAFHAGVQCM